MKCFGNIKMPEGFGKVNYRALSALLFMVCLAMAGCIAYIAMFTDLCGGNLTLNRTHSHSPRGIYRKTEKVMDWKCATVNIDGKKVVCKLNGGGKSFGVKLDDLVCIDLNELYEAYPAVRDDIFIKLAENMHLLKRVGAVEGDVISVKNHRVCVNGKVLPRAYVFEKYRNGTSRVKISYPYIVPKGHVFLIADRTDSFDSRYYGAVPMEFIQYKAEPVLTVGE